MLYRQFGCNTSRDLSHIKFDLPYTDIYSKLFYDDKAIIAVDENGLITVSNMVYAQFRCHMHFDRYLLGLIVECSIYLSNDSA